MNDGTGAIAITTRLFLGPPEAARPYEDMLPVDNVSDAMTAIASGHSALLPPESWEMAGEVLRRFGATEEHIAFRLGMAGCAERCVEIRGKGNGVMPSSPDPWRKINWEQRLKCGCVIPVDITMSAKGFYQIYGPYGPRTADCPKHGEQRVIKRWEVS